MKRISHIKKTLLLAALVLVGTRSLYSAGTPAGTVISSRALATYTTASGGNIDSVYSSVVSFVVKQVAVVNALPSFTTKNSDDGISVDYSLSLLNSGNGTDKFTLTHLSSQGWQVFAYRDINGNGILDAADSIAGTIASTDSVKADSSFKIIVRVSVPDNEALNGQSDSTTFTIASQYDGSKSGHSVLQTKVQTAQINTNSSLSVDNAAPNPPGPVTFTLSITNSGQLAATNIVVIDQLDARFGYLSSTGGGVHIATDSVQWTIPSLASGTSINLTVTVNVQMNLPLGTIIPAAMTIAYNDGGLHRNKISNTVNVGTVTSYGVTIAPDSVNDAKEPADTVKYYFTLKNTGSVKDVIELSANSSQPLPWQFRKDVNNNRVVDPADSLLKNTNGHAGVDVDSVAAGDSVHVFAIAVIPAVTIDQTKDITAFTATSAGNSLKLQSATATTTTNIPVVNIAVAVSPLPSQPQPPGGVLTYTISYSNQGHADIDTSYTIAARIPDSTSFVLGSAKLGALSLPDSTVVRNGVVSIKTGGLKKSVSGSAEFKVKIK